jgi:Cu2+-exporting ATPase
VDEVIAEVLPEGKESVIRNLQQQGKVAMVGAAAMSLSSFCVVSNALRLNLFHMHNAGHDRAKKEKAVRTGEIRLRIEGMMCEHCEATVKKALEKVEGVISATASYREGTAVVQTDGSASSDALGQAVEAADYKVLE